MSEPALYKRKTKSGHVIPGVTLDELTVMHFSGRKLDSDELVQVIGKRTFDSDEKWLPAVDFPELADLFPGTTGRAVIAAEIGRTKSVRRYAIFSLLLCILAAVFFWWKPYQDAEDARGNLIRVTADFDSASEQSAKLLTQLKATKEVGEVRQKSLERMLEDERQKLYDATDKLKLAQDTLRKLEMAFADASTNVSQLQSMNKQLSVRLNEAEQPPKFWPGADALRAPADLSQVRVVSMIPDRGYVYVVARKSYPKGSILMLKQPGMLGAKMSFRVVTIYAHAQGEVGLALQNPDVDDDSVRKFTAFGYGETLDCVTITPSK
jgi:hypothetical protein